MMNQGDYFGADGRIDRYHKLFVDRLAAINTRIPDSAAGPYGLGGMIAFTPFGGKADRVKRLLAAMFDAGLISFMTGGDVSRLRFLILSLGLTEQDIAAVCDILEESLAAEAALH